MAHYEHVIVIGEESLDIKIELIDEEEKEFTISSDSPMFAEIFSTDNFRIRQEDVGMDNFVLGNVIPRFKPRAEEILAEIRKLI